MLNSKRSHWDLWAALFLAFLGVLFFADVLFRGNVFFASDLTSLDLPGKVLFRDMVRQGRLPLWNPYIFSGVPFLADINFGLLSPFTLFYFFFAPYRALSLNIVTAVILSGIGMYAYGRALRMSRWGSLMSGAVFMFSGSVMTYTMNTAILNSIVWYPFLLLCLEKLSRSKEVKYTIYSAMFLALIFFGGHVQYYYYALLLVFFAVVLKPGHWGEKFMHLAYVVVPSLFLAAVQLLPFLEYSRYSTRPLQDLAYAAGNASPLSFIRLLLPRFFGTVRDGTSWGATADLSGYAGLVPLVLALLAIVKNRTRPVLFYASVAGIALLLALGRYSPLYLAAFYAVPYFSRFRTPGAILVLYTFAVALLSGWGLDYLFASVAGAGRLKKYVPYAALVAALGLVAGLSLAGAGPSAFGGLKALPLFSRLSSYPAAKADAIFLLWTESLAMASLFLFVFWMFLWSAKARACFTPVQKFLLVLLAVSDLFYFASGAYVTENETLLKAPGRLVEFLARDKSLFRIATLSDPGAKPPYGNPQYLAGEAFKALDLLQPDVNMTAHLESAGGYASIVPASYSAFLGSAPGDPTSVIIPAPGSAKLDELGVKYILTAGARVKELDATEKYRKVFAFEDPRIGRTFSVYENTAAYPRVYTINHAGVRSGKAVVTSATAGRMEVYADMPGEGLLVVSAQYFPGWKAQVNGRKTTVSPYKIFQSVALKTGENRITLSYEPDSFYAGAFISAANWLYMLGFLVYLGMKKHEKVRQKLHVSKPEVQKYP